ncbi:MAG TPA: helix-turn-helix domain-containing protein [Thermodesulfobacteriota bacterium]|nr:helix-turn-helix domain-containing protein [Thermodesulfobacteriota bacterium]
MSDKKQDKTKIVQIWGEILDEGFTSVPNILLRYRSRIGLKPKHIMLIIDIMSYKWDSEYPFPSYSTLAARSGIEERSVKRITQDLEELKLLIKTPRFDDETGAQVTTVFDFRPLVQKLIEEMNKGEDEVYFEDDEEYGVGRLSKENITPQRNNNKEINKLRHDKNVMGEGDNNVTRGVTKLSPGGVTIMSPKEYSYNKKTISKRTRGESLTYSREKARGKIAASEDEKRVRKYLRDAIFRKRIFEVYDNLINVKSIEEIVEEGAYRACKDMIVNRVLEIEGKGASVDPAKVAKLTRKNFPYGSLPRDAGRKRNVFTSTLCDLVSSIVVNSVVKKGAV